MSSCFMRHFILSLTSFSLFWFNSAFIFPVRKDISSLQYVAEVRYGAPSAPVKLVVDLNGPFSWSDCSTSSSPSANHRPIHFRSLQCSTAKTNGPGADFVKSGSGTGCGLSMTNPISKVSSWGNLVEETVAVDYIDGQRVNTIAIVDHYRILTYCAPTLFLHGLSSGSKGVFGLGNTRMAIQTQLAMSYGLDRKFSICLSPSEGFINIGSWSQAVSLTPETRTDVSRLLAYTPLITKSGNTGEKREYFINVKAVEINGQRISLPLARHEPLRAKLSTTVPYTTMESSIYAAFVKTYITLASSMNMTRVSAVEPFGVCFKMGNADKNGDRTTAMPSIELTLQSELVKWRITESNSLVKVNEEMKCLAFLDGGSSSSALIVIGGYQLEDNFLQFDAATSMLGFSSSLLDRGLTCSNLLSTKVHNS